MKNTHYIPTYVFTIMLISMWCHLLMPDVRKALKKCAKKFIKKLQLIIFYCCLAKFEYFELNCSESNYLLAQLIICNSLKHFQVLIVNKKEHTIFVSTYVCNIYNICM